MLAIPHMVAGAAIARRVRPGWLALSLAFLSHFLLDMIPHIGTHKFLDPTAARLTVSESVFALLDFFIGAALVAWAALGRSDRRMVFAGGLLGILIDLVEYVPPWNAWYAALPGADRFIAFHNAIQWNVGFDQWPIGYGTQILVIAISLSMLLRSRRTAADMV